MPTRLAVAIGACLLLMTSIAAAAGYTDPVPYFPQTTNVIREQAGTFSCSLSVVATTGSQSRLTNGVWSCTSPVSSSNQFMLVAETASRAVRGTLQGPSFSYQHQGSTMQWQSNVTLPIGQAFFVYCVQVTTLSSELVEGCVETPAV